MPEYFTPWTAEGYVIKDSENETILNVDSGDAEHDDLLIQFITKACNNHEAMTNALQEALGAMDSLRTQIDQMKGMFDDEDGNIQSAIMHHELVEPLIQSILNTVKE